MKGKRGLATILTLSMLMYLFTGFSTVVIAADAPFVAESLLRQKTGSCPAR